MRQSAKYVIEKAIRIPQSGILLVLKINSNDMRIINPFRLKVLTEQIKEKIGLPAPSDTSDYLHQSIVFSCYKPIEVSISLNVHLY